MTHHRCHSEHDAASATDGKSIATGNRCVGGSHDELVPVQWTPLDPVTLALSILLRHPDAATSAFGRATAPSVNQAQMQESFADLARGVLHCYHKSARFQSTDYLGAPWNRQGQYGAQASMVVRITYAGVTMAPYEMVVAVMAKDNQVRTAVLRDTALVPYSAKCELESWTGG